MSLQLSSNVQTALKPLEAVPVVGDVLKLGRLGAAILGAQGDAKRGTIDFQAAELLRVDPALIEPLATPEAARLAAGDTFTVIIRDLKSAIAPWLSMLDLMDRPGVCGAEPEVCFRKGPGPLEWTQRGVNDMLARLDGIGLTARADALRKAVAVERVLPLLRFNFEDGPNLDHHASRPC